MTTLQSEKEQSIQHAILDYLALMRIVAWKNSNVGIYNKKTRSFIPSHTRGVSDILGILPTGRFLAIEVKRPKQKPTEEQQLFLDTINENGGLAFVAHSIDDVEDNLPLDTNFKDSIYSHKKGN